MSERNEIGGRVRVELSRQGMFQKDLADGIGIPQDAMSRSLKGERAFSSVELARAAEMLATDLHWLITGEPDPMSMRVAARHDFDHDTGQRANPGRREDETVLEQIALAYRQAWASPPVATEPVPEDPAEVRELLGGQFVRDFANRIEGNLGVDVVRVPGLSTDYSITIGGNRVIVTAAQGSWWRTNWSIAHELGHLALGHHHDPADVDSSEAAANRFAAGLLLPRQELTPIDWTSVDEAFVASFLWEHGVSADALRRRLNSLSLSTSDDVDSLLSRPMPGVLRRFEQSFRSGEGTIGRLRLKVSAIDERMEAATQRRFPALLLARHRELTESHRINPSALAWMLQVDAADLGIAPPPLQPSDELAAAFGIE